MVNESGYSRCSRFGLWALGRAQGTVVLRRLLDDPKPRATRNTPSLLYRRHPIPTLARRVLGNGTLKLSE